MRWDPEGRSPFSCSCSNQQLLLRFFSLNPRVAFFLFSHRRQAQTWEYSSSDIRTVISAKNKSFVCLKTKSKLQVTTESCCNSRPYEVLIDCPIHPSHHRSWNAMRMLASQHVRESSWLSESQHFYFPGVVCIRPWFTLMVLHIRPLALNLTTRPGSRTPCNTSGGQKSIQYDMTTAGSNFQSQDH